MYTSKKEYSLLVKGELYVINDELEKFINENFNECFHLSNYLNRIKIHLGSIEQKIGKSSIEHIDISTKIVDVFTAKAIELTSIDKTIDHLSPADTVKYYANQRNNLTEAMRIIRQLEEMNMDYAYRVNKFSKVKAEFESRCHELGIDIRTTAQRSVEKLKSVGEFTGVVAKETAGCAFVLAFKIAIWIVIFLILMAIIGVK